MQIVPYYLVLWISSDFHHDFFHSEAASVLQELQVETYGSMEKREKVEYLLEQIRLCLAKRDFVRMQIISKKVSVKFFEDNKEQVS